MEIADGADLTGVSAASGTRLEAVVPIAPGVALLPLVGGFVVFGSGHGGRRYPPNGGLPPPAFQ